MANTLFENVPFVFCGLGTLTFVTTATQMYTVRVESTEIPSSELAVVVKDNGSTIFTAPVLGQTQSSMQFTFSKVLTTGHTITVVLSSSAANDNLLNSVKTSVAIGGGL